MAAMAAILEIYFARLLLNRNSKQFTRNLVGSIWVTCRSDIAIFSDQKSKIAAILKIYFEQKGQGQLTGKLIGIIRVTCRSKIYIAKISLARNPR